jgi:hypothetical protein
MICISHRINNKQALYETPEGYGVEVDIRGDSNGKLYIHHDPLVGGESFESWLEAYNHRFVILNVKEEGLEAPLIELMERNGITEFFFLDQSFPFLVKTAKAGESRCAVRVSEFESIETALSLAGKVDWVWIDYFSKFPLDAMEFGSLKEAGFKTCLVSPELQGFDIGEVERVKEQLGKEGIELDAVCTKHPTIWSG